MRRSLIWLLPALVCAWPAPGRADTITCPTAIGGVTGFDRQYTLAEADACVYGEGPLNANPLEDVFLLGGATGGDLGGGWTGIGETNPEGNNLSGIEIGFDSDQKNSGTWTLTFGNLLPAYSSFTEFAFGLVDGGTPKWAVFLLTITQADLDAGFVTGTWDIDGVNDEGVFKEGIGAFSHASLYGRDGEGVEQIPEPATLLLIGTGVAAYYRRYRRRVRST